MKEIIRFELLDSSKAGSVLKGLWVAVGAQGWRSVLPECVQFYDESYIRDRIAHMASGQNPEMSQLVQTFKSSTDWSKAFPLYKLGSGQIVFDTQDPQSNLDAFAALTWLITHREQFLFIDGLGAVRRVLKEAFGEDFVRNSPSNFSWPVMPGGVFVEYIECGRFVSQDSMTSQVFSQINHANKTSVVFKLCEKFSAPDLYLSWVDFQNVYNKYGQSEALNKVWQRLRGSVVPWASYGALISGVQATLSQRALGSLFVPPVKPQTVWGLCSELHTRLSGKTNNSDSSLFQNTAPDLDFLEACLIKSSCYVPQKN